MLWYNSFNEIEGLLETAQKVDFRLQAYNLTMDLVTKNTSGKLFKDLVNGD